MRAGVGEDIPVLLPVADTVEAATWARVGRWSNCIVRSGFEANRARGKVGQQSGDQDCDDRRWKSPRLSLHQWSDQRPSGSRQETRERENEDSIGGMRNPAHAVGKVPGLRRAGLIARGCLEEFLDEEPGVEQAITDSIADGECRLKDELQEKMVLKLAAAFGAKSTSRGPRSL